MPAGRQQQAGEEIAHAPPKLSLLCRDLVLLSLALTAAYNDPATERSLAFGVNTNTCRQWRRFQIEEQIQLEIQIEIHYIWGDDPNIRDSHWSLAAAC